MLEPGSRTLFLDAFRPPEGFHLGSAVGTTFTLDLEALLLPPLALAMFDTRAGDDTEIGTDPIALLEAVRRIAEDMVIFCQAGYIHVPRHHRLITCYLEESINEVTAPTPGFIFHPKVWCLRFDNNGGTSTYRLLCASRNLTFDTSWDTLLVLDGQSVGPSERLRRLNEPLSDLLQKLVKMSSLIRPTSRTEISARMAEEVRRVEWTAPNGFVFEGFHSIGLGETSPLSKGCAAERALVVSPFVSDDFLSQIARSSQATLVSRAESLDRLNTTTLDAFKDVYILDPNANSATDETTDETANAGLVGLHAKLFVFDDGPRSTIFTGSTNATHAGLGGNVEFLVRLSGARNNVGVNAALAEGSPTEPTWRDLLINYQRPDQTNDPSADEQEEAQTRLERIGQELAVADWTVRVTREGDSATLVIVPPSLKGIPSNVAVSCCPVTLNRQTQHWDGKNYPTFGPIAIESVTPFVTVQLQGSAAPGRPAAKAWFVVNAELDGDFPNRRERILASQLANARDVLRYLLFLLAESGQTFDATKLAALALTVDGRSEIGVDRPVEMPLLEALVRTLSRDPKRLDVVNRLVNDLLAAKPDGSLLPPGFLDVWSPMWTAREKIR